MHVLIGIWNQNSITVIYEKCCSYLSISIFTLRLKVSQTPETLVQMMDDVESEEEEEEEEEVIGKGASINYVDKEGGGRVAKCQQYYYVVKLSTKGGKKSLKSCQRILWMPLT